MIIINLKKKENERYDLVYLKRKEEIKVSLYALGVKIKMIKKEHSNPKRT